MLKRIINTIIWSVVLLYLIIVTLFHIPMVQNAIGSKIAEVLSNKLGTSVYVGRVDLGFANKLIIDEVQIADQKGKQMLRAARLSAKMDMLQLLRGRIVITSSQFFGTKVNLYKEDAKSPLNCQFIIDSLSSKQPNKKPSTIDLQVGALIIRNGQLSYRRYDKIKKLNQLSLNSVDLHNISGHIILNKLTNDSLNLKVKKLSFDDKSGLQLQNLGFHIIASRSHAVLSNFILKLPHSNIELNKCEAKYEIDKGKLDVSSLQFHGGISNSFISLNDFSCFIPKLKNIGQTLNIRSSFKGNGENISIETLQLSNSRNSLNFSCNANINNILNPKQRSWKASLQHLIIRKDFIFEIANALNFSLPKIINNLGNISLQGNASGIGNMSNGNFSLKTDIGTIQLGVLKGEDNVYKAKGSTQNFNLQQLTDNQQLGLITADISVEGINLNDFYATANIRQIQFKAYDYHNIKLEATRNGGNYEGKLDVHDSNIEAVINAKLQDGVSQPSLSLQASILDISPSQLHLSNKWANSRFGFNLLADIKGRSIHDATGTISLNDFMKTQIEKEHYAFDHLTITSEKQSKGRRLTIDSDFANMEIDGNFDYATLPNSIFTLVGHVLPTLPGLTKIHSTNNNEFTLNAKITDTQWMGQLLNIPLEIREPLTLSASLDDHKKKANVLVNAPDFMYGGKPYFDTSLHISTPNDTIRAVAHTDKLMDNGRLFTWDADVLAHNDRMSASIDFDNHERHPFRGSLHLDTQLHKDEKGISTAYVDVKESNVTVGDATWKVRPSSIIYKKNNLSVEGFSFENEDQHVAINGCASNHPSDSLFVDLKNVDVSYILNLVNFHAVDFSGLASGRAYVSNVFSGNPQAKADLSIADFRFENGRMGTLSAMVDYNNLDGQINIDAVANDVEDRKTYVNGYVSPKQSYIDLGIVAHNTRLEFMQSFCSSFLQDVDATAQGKLRLFGPLSNINLTGELVANGSVGVSSLETNYTFHNDTVRLIPDEIQFRRDTIYDRNGNIGILSGNLYHKHLTNLSYDLNVKAKNLLSYDTHTYGENTFFGTVFATGDCRIVGRSGEVNFDINATPNKGTIITYKVDSYTELSSSDFLTWVSPTSQETLKQQKDSLFHGHVLLKDHDEEKKGIDYATDIRMNFLVNCTPDATIKLIMDEQSGDYITLNGDGGMRATYYNKGSFDLYGNYIVDHGLYKLTIQNVIRKDFTFQQGGVIAFGGDPFDANINLKALYVLNGVSLSDLNIGRSFNNNNVRVDCLMNITGTPASPKVDFSLDMPTLGSDVKQMVHSIINAEEEMNQQVLYLLAVGRFYNRGTNNAGDVTLQDSQTSLAMQSFLSGTISQQINQVLGSVVNSSNWNFGANISTGSEGFYNAEYEGLLSGRLLNNRLIFNGQFGYRDNANATTSFIGDFDLRYLLFPNGNLSVNVYNKANDRYFTRNSLNTQGIGITIKRDFNGLRELFNIRNRKPKKAEKE